MADATTYERMPFCTSAESEQSTIPHPKKKSTNSTTDADLTVDEVLPVNDEKIESEEVEEEFDMTEEELDFVARCFTGLHHGNSLDDIKLEDIPDFIKEVLCLVILSMP